MSGVWVIAFRGEKGVLLSTVPYKQFYNFILFYIILLFVICSALQAITNFADMSNI